MINTLIKGLILFKGNAAEISDFSADEAELFNSVRPA
jgi:hypothetical protein